MIKLVGILVVALGFLFRFNTLLVVMVAGIVTGLVSGMSFEEIMTLFGNFFIENRYMSLPIILTLPVIGVLERYGLKERAQTLISGAKNATAGRVISMYMIVRQATIAVGINIGGHAQMIRPLIVPMSEGAAQARHGEMPENIKNDIKAYSAAAENIAYFFGQTLFVASGAVLLMKGFFDSSGMDIEIWSIALWALPTAIAVLIIGILRLVQLDRRIARASEKSKEEMSQ